MPGSWKKRIGWGESERAALIFARDLLIIGALAFGYFHAADFLLERFPGELTVRTDIIGYPTFFAFDVDRYFREYLVLSFGLLACVGVLYLLLARRLPAAEPAAWWPAHGSSVRRLDRVALPTMLVAAAAIFVAPGAVGIFLAIAAMVAGALAWRAKVGRGRLAEGAVLLPSALIAALAVRMLAQAGVVAGGLFHPFVTPRLAAVLIFAAAAALAAGALWVAWKAPGSRRAARIAVYEGVAVVAILYLVYFQVVAGPVDTEFFHDGENLAPAAMMLRGAFPWRDFASIHGLLQDGLKTLAAFLLLGETQWAASTIDPLLYPLYVAGFYWFFRVALAGNVLAAAAGAFFVSDYFWSGSVQHPDLRMFFLPFCLLLLLMVFRRGTWVWCLGFAALATIQIVVTPEFAFFGLAAGLTVVLHDAVQAARTGSARGAFRRTLLCLAGTLMTAAVVAAFLAWHGALAPFVQILLEIARNHQYVGGLPKQLVPYFKFYTGYPLVCALAVLLGAVAMLHRRMTPQPWYLVAVALAVCTMLYDQKYLGRADAGHIRQPLMIAAPLFVLTVAAAALVAESAAASAAGALARWRRHRGAALAALAGLSFVVAVPPVTFTPLGVQASEAARTLHARTIAGIADKPALPKTGFFALPERHAAVVRDVGAFLDRHLAPEARVFDMTNSPGLFFYFLERRSASRYFHVTLPARERTQLAVLRELEAARPQLVVYDQARWGLGMASWDQIHNEVRHPLISYYIRAHYAPLAEVAGYWIWIRRDGTAPAQAHEATVSPVCQWGHVPYFARFGEAERVGKASPASPVSPWAPTSRTELSGWAGAPDRTLYRRAVYAVLDGQVVGQTTTDLPRVDVYERFKSKDMMFSGFRLALGAVDPARLRVFAQVEDGVAELDDTTRPHGEEAAREEIRLPDGAVLEVRHGLKIGVVDGKTSGPAQLGRWTLDRPVYALHVDIAGRNPDAVFELLDQNGDVRVVFKGARAERATLTVPVGACRAWSDRGALVIRASAPSGAIPAVTGVRGLELSLETLLAQ